MYICTCNVYVYMYSKYVLILEDQCISHKTCTPTFCIYILYFILYFWKQLWNIISRYFRFWLTSTAGRYRSACPGLASLSCIEGNSRGWCPHLETALFHPRQTKLAPRLTRWICSVACTTETQMDLPSVSDILFQARWTLSL